MVGNDGVVPIVAVAPRSSDLIPAAWKFLVERRFVAAAVFTSGRHCREYAPKTDADCCAIRVPQRLRDRHRRPADG
jgi:hypothetical protein